MTPGDLDYLALMASRGLFSGPVLEVGSYAWQGRQGNCESTCKAQGIPWEGADIQVGPGVDFELDILDSNAIAAIDRRWSTVLAFNLIEHLYDPIRALENMAQLVMPGGSLVVLSPLVWEVHSFPGDFWRPLPQFYDQFASNNGMAVRSEGSYYIVGRHLVERSATRSAELGEDRIPSKGNYETYVGKKSATWSNLVNRVFNTAGRSMHFPYVAYATVITAA